jgi:hypothetical protein
MRATTKKNPKTLRSGLCNAKKSGIGTELLGTTHKNPKTPADSQKRTASASTAAQ